MVSMKVKEQFVKYERCGHWMHFVLKSSNVLESDVHSDCCWQWLAVILLLLLPCVTSQWSYRHKDTAVDLDSVEVASVAPNGSANYILDWMSKLVAFSGTNVRLKNSYLLLAFSALSAVLLNTLIWWNTNMCSQWAHWVTLFLRSADDRRKRVFERKHLVISVNTK